MGEAFPYRTLVELLQYWNSHDSHKPAFIFVDKDRNRFELTRRELYELGGRWASVLQREGVGRKEKVVSTLTNCPERVLCDVGIVLAGAVVVNAQCQLADGSDLLLILRQSKACAVCINPDLDIGPWTVLKQHGQHDPVTNTFTSPSLPDLRKVFFIRRTSPLPQAWPEVKGQESLEDSFSSPDTGDFIAGLHSLHKLYAAEVAAEETAIVFTTSGSTGFSKLVPHTHEDIITYFNIVKSSPIDEYYIVFSTAPLGWLGGYTFISMALGMTRLLLDEWYGFPDDLADLVWNTVVEENCYSAALMPFLLTKILAMENRKDWKLKNVYFGGHPMKKMMMQKALQLSDSVNISYGSSELLAITVMLLTDISKYQEFLSGHPLPGNTVKICDSDGKEVARGSRGEIYAKTPFMSKAYLNSAEDTAAAFTLDGFLKTGDTGVMLEDGSLLVEGRQQDAIHRGSYIFYPAWLENRILQCCPGLQDVFIVGVPDPAMGEEICACFVPSDPSLTEEQVRQRVEEDIISGLQSPMSPRPRYFLSFQSFPRTYTDKPSRKDVRRLAIQRLQLA